MSSSGTSKIGGQIRYQRRLRGMTLQGLAAKAECSESMVSKVETGRVNPSLTMLSRLAKALGINVSTFFVDEQLSEVVMRSGTRPRLDTDALRRGDGITLERLAPYAEGCMLQANIHIVAAGGRSDGVISHLGEEVGFLLEGELELEVDGQRYQLRPGDSFYFSSDRPHGYRNLGSSEARVLWVNTPPTF
ncbi:MAG: XRE family transcriptional regulator [Pseudomonadota bacterium]